MKSWLSSVLCLSLLLGNCVGLTACSSSDKPLLDGATLVTFGDSLTALSSWPQEVATTLNMQLVNAGIGGNTSEHGLLRFAHDVILEDPDFVIICFGSNDFYRPSGTDAQVSAEDYRANLQAMIDQTIEADAVPILMTPPFISESASGGSANYPEGSVNKALDVYVDVMRELAEDNKIDLIDIHEVCDNGQSVTSFLSADGVHLSSIGDDIYADTITAYMAEHFRTDPNAPRVEAPTAPTAEEGNWTKSLVPSTLDDWRIIYPDTVQASMSDDGIVSFSNTTGEWPEVHYSPKLQNGIAARVAGSYLTVDLELQAAANILLFFNGSTPTVQTNDQYLSLTAALKEAIPTLRTSGDDIQGGQTVQCTLSLRDIIPLNYIANDGTVLFSGVKVFVIGAAGKTVTIRELSVTST